MKEKLKKQIEAKLNTLEEKTKNPVVSSNEIKKGIREVNKFINSSIKLVENEEECFTEEEIKEFEDRLSKLKEPYSITFVSPRNRSISPNVKKNIAVALAGVTIAGVVITTAACGIANAKEENIQETEVNSEVVEQSTEVVEVVEPVKEETMSEEIINFSNDTVLAIDNTLKVGINIELGNNELTENDKEVYAKLLTNYRIVTNIDDFTNLQYAELFGEKLNPSSDLIESYFNYNMLIEKHLLTVTKDNMLEYDTLYNNKKDAEVLNKSEELIANINEASNKKEKKEAAIAWYDYVINTLKSSEGNIQLSNQALDTLIYHCEAFDELTRSDFSKVQGAHVDDELEHTLNVAKNACLDILNNNEQIDAQEYGIENLKSVYRLSFMKKLDDKFDCALSERTLQLTLENELNALNSYDEIIAYVTNRVDLSLYKPVKIDYIEKQIKEKKLDQPAEKAKNDSGISNGVNGNLSTEQLNNYGISPNEPAQIVQEKLEEAVRQETELQSEASARVTTQDAATGSEGNVLQGTQDAATGSEGDVLQGTQEDNVSGFQAGYAAGNSGQAKPSYTGNQAYDSGIDSGYALGSYDRQEMLKNLDTKSETNFEPVQNGPETTTESGITTQDYTTQNSTNSNSNSNNTTETNNSSSNSNNTTETNNYGNYETNFIPAEEIDEEPVAYNIQNEISQWVAFRNYVVGYSVEEDYSKSKV